MRNNNCYMITLTDFSSMDSALKYQKKVAQRIEQKCNNYDCEILWGMSDRDPHCGTYRYISTRKHQIPTRMWFGRNNEVTPHVHILIRGYGASTIRKHILSCCYDAPNTPNCGRAIADTWNYHVMYVIKQSRHLYSLQIGDGNNLPCGFTLRALIHRLMYQRL